MPRRTRRSLFNFTPPHLSHCQESVDEIRERARILSHEGVASAAKLGKLSPPGDRIDECQCIRRWDDDVFGARGDECERAQVPEPVADTVAMPGIHRQRLPMNELGGQPRACCGYDVAELAVD